MRKLRLLSFVLFLLAALPVHAQWTGSIDLSGGAGWMPPTDKEIDNELFHFKGRGEISIGYKTPKFQWNTVLGGSYDNNETDNTRVSFSGNEAEKKASFDSFLKYGKAYKGDFSLRNTFRWTPGGKNVYEAWINGRYKPEDGNYYIYKERIDIGGESESKPKGDFTAEGPENEEFTLDYGFRTWHHLDGDKTVLGADISFENQGKDKSTTWVIAGVEGESFVAGQAYRLTPRTDNMISRISLHVSDSIITEGPYRLRVDPGLRIRVDHTKDLNSGATLISDIFDENPQWKDSTALRETFDFLAVSAGPYVSLDFSWDRLKVHADYAPDFYFRRLNNQEHFQKLHFVRVHMVGESSLRWSFSQMHSISVFNKMTVKHPPYIQICWYERQGTYANQLYRGNANLRPTYKHVYGLGYNFKYWNIRSSTSMEFTKEGDQIDQTFTNEELDGRMYKVFTWVNSADANIFALSEQLTWQKNRLQTSVGVKYNRKLHISKLSNERKKSEDWSAWLNASLALPRDWSISADVKYQSAVATFFTLFKQYCTFNARVQKRLGQITLYLQGNDLLDNGITREFTSADQSEVWLEFVRLNRRLVILGFQWNF